MNNKSAITTIVSIIIAVIVIAVMCTTIKSAAPVVNNDGSLIIQRVIKPQATANTTYDWNTSRDPISLSDDEYDLLCRVLCLEDGGESEWSQRCVAGVIYNRLASGLWGSTISEVLYAENQFEVMPYVWQAEPSELTKSVITDVFINGNNQVPQRVMYFRTGYYFAWARAEFNCGNVYFSSSWWYQ